MVLIYIYVFVARLVDGWVELIGKCFFCELLENGPHITAPYYGAPFYKILPKNQLWRIFPIHPLFIFLIRLLYL